METKLKELIKRVLMKSEKALTMTQIRDEILCEAVRELTGKTTFELKDLREALNELVNEGELDIKNIDKPFKAFEINKEKVKNGQKAS